MKNKAAGFFITVLLLTLTMNGVGCSRFFQPSDAEVLKAIDDSGVLKSNSFTITSPVVIVERLKRNNDGSWPVRVKMTIAIQMPNGKTSEPKENSTTFRISKSTDSAGRSVWKAVLGS